MATLTTAYQYIGCSNKLKPQSGSYGYYLLLYAKSVPNTTTGIHAVSIKTVLACTIASSFYQYPCTYSGTINGSSAFSGTNKPWSAWNTEALSAGGTTYKRWIDISNGSVNVDCSNGLSKDITVVGKWKLTDPGTTYTPAQNAEAIITATVTLPAIHLKSTVTATDANIGATSSIIITSYKAEYTHSLYYKFNGQSSYTTIQHGVTSSVYGWTVPDSAYALIPNSKTIKCTIMCETLNGSTSMGSNICEITVTAAEAECAPTISVTAVDTNQQTVELTGNNKKIVKGWSNVRVTTTAQAKHSASISSISVKCGSKTGTGSSCTINQAESAEIISTITDTRGYTNSAQAANLSLINYIPLTVNPTITRESPGSNTVTVAISGNYFNGSFGATSNTITATANVKPSGGEYGSETTIPVTVSGNTYTGTVTFTNVSYQTTNDIRVTVSDKIYGNVAASKTVTTTLNKGVPLFDWGEDNFRFNIPVIFGSSASGINISHIDSAGAVTGSVLQYAVDTRRGITPFITGANSTDIPGVLYKYSNGIVHKRTDEMIDLYIKNYQTGTVAVRTYYNGTWTAWQYFVAASSE